MENDTRLVVFLIILFPVFFMGIWFLVNYLISRMGWSKLAVFYHAGDPISGKTLRLSSLLFGWGASYNNVVYYTLSEKGLGISIMILFRMFHPPLFIPWKDLKETGESSLFFFRYRNYEVGDTGVRIRIRLNVAKQFDEYQTDRNYY